MIFPVFFVAFLALMIFLLVMSRNLDTRSEKEGEDMIKTVYLYLVLFVTLMMIIGGSVGAFMALADMLAPTPYYMSFEDYKLRFTDKSPTGQEVSPMPTEEEMRRGYEDMVQTERDRQVVRAKNSLIKSFGWIVIPLPVFLFFQRKLGRGKEALG